MLEAKIAPETHFAHPTVIRLKCISQKLLYYELFNDYSDMNRKLCTYEINQQVHGFLTASEKDFKLKVENGSLYGSEINGIILLNQRHTPQLYLGEILVPTVADSKKIHPILATS